MKIAHYDETNGKLLGWYDSEIHKEIPTPNIEVNETDWQTAIDNSYNYIDVTKNNLSVKDFRTDDEILIQQAKNINNAIQNHLDTKAQEYKWDNMQSARAAAVPIKDNDSDAVKAMKNNAETLMDWYFNVWAKASEIQADVKAGNRDMPTVDEVLTELPTYE